MCKDPEVVETLICLRNVKSNVAGATEGGDRAVVAMTRELTIRPYKTLLAMKDVSFSATERERGSRILSRRGTSQGFYLYWVPLSSGKPPRQPS